MKRDSAFEVNFDGLIGPTHNYSGLSYGNIASLGHAHSISNPKAAAKEGLQKMRLLAQLGLKQAILPPHERPFLPLLYDVGYRGEPHTMLARLAKENPQLLMAISSAASMWAANAATVCPSADSQDGKVHFTAANLISKLHRQIESPTTHLILKKIFSHPDYFTHHPPLMPHSHFADEGAANHTRFCQSYADRGLHLFVFGRDAQKSQLTKKFPARQTKEASEAIARLHQIDGKQVVLAQQNPEAIDAGVFHNDVIAVGNQNVFFYHAKAFAKQVITLLQKKIEAICCIPPCFIEVSQSQIPLQEAVRTYLFNSQLVTLPDQSMALIAPSECEHSPLVLGYLNELLTRNNHPIKQLIFQDIRQSMQNGGGPACLRLRVVLTKQELAHTHAPIFFTEDLYIQLNAWIDQHYRDRLQLKDLSDPQLLSESQQALDELTRILQLGSVYPFQGISL
jgi:succinylarginine dihydrolase